MPPWLADHLLRNILPDMRAMAIAPRDEMVDGSGGLRPAWRGLLGSAFGLGHGALAERGHLLDRIIAEEAVTALLPGARSAAWRCDPIPLPLSGAEFAVLESGLAQRARLLNAVLADVYGPQELLASGALPPALVFANPAFLRPCRAVGRVADSDQLRFYAADLIRGPDGAWHVAADHAGGGDGVAHALANRGALGRVLPELFRAAAPRPLRAFLEGWGDALQRLLPAAGPDGDDAPTVALLTGGHGDPMWFEHATLSRELSCALVEGGDVTVRGGALYLKTLRGLTRIGVLLRRQDGRWADPLELMPDSSSGVAGLLDAVRAGTVRVVNGLGSGAVEVPALAAFLPGLARRLLGEALALAGVPTLWLGTEEARETVLRDPDAWLLRPALDGTAPPVRAGSLPAPERHRLMARIAQAPWEFVAAAAMPPSVAPCVGPDGIVPRPVVLRLFLFHDGARWRAMQGGLARVLSDEDVPTGPPPLRGLSKDVWVLAHDQQEAGGPAAPRPQAPAIRRGSGDLPSRVADEFFWLGRYLERLEGAARLLRAAIVRITRPVPTPRETADLAVLTACLVRASLVDREAASSLGTGPLVGALLHAAEPGEVLAGLLGHVARLSGQLQDRLSGEMHAAIAQALRELEASLLHRPDLPAAPALEGLAHALTRVLRFAATVAGLAAENMVRGGGRLFLDLGRRVERAQAVAADVAEALDQPGAATQPGRVDSGLLLALELADSSITYRNRYPSGLQPAPALDLILADRGNPRALAFQLAQARELLAGIGDGGDLLSAVADRLLADAAAMVEEVARAADPAAAASFLPPRLRALRAEVSELSDELARRYFALLPPPRSTGFEGGAGRCRDIA